MWRHYEIFSVFFILGFLHRKYQRYGLGYRKIAPMKNSIFCSPATMMLISSYPAMKKPAYLWKKNLKNYLEKLEEMNSTIQD
jgi:hypothetical protein